MTPFLHVDHEERGWSAVLESKFLVSPALGRSGTIVGPGLGTWRQTPPPPSAWEGAVVSTQRDRDVRTASRAGKFFCTSQDNRFAPRLIKTQ